MNQPENAKVNKALSVFDNPNNGKLLTHLNSCVHCGLCAESCLYYTATGDSRYTPARKVELVSSVYRRYGTLTGRYLPWLVNARELDDQTLEEMTDQLFGACTICGRCTLHCSIGIDIGYLVRTGRRMLSELDMVPKTLQSTVDAAVQTGNNMAITKEEFVSTIRWMEEELQDETGDPKATIPLDEPGKKVLYTLNPREPKFFPLSISAMAKIFYAAGESWTLSTRMYDVTNYAYFSGNNDEAALIAKRLKEEALSMQASQVVLAECGHGSRAFRWEGPNYLSEPMPFETITSVELIARYMREGRIKTDPAKITQTVTLHDPCNLVRSGGIVEEQRYILKQFAGDFREMTPHGIDNYCCGGGGGQLAMSEYNERRMAIAGVKAEQIKKTGARIVVTPCHNCVDQLIQTNQAYRLGVQIKTLAEIVADALILT